MRIAWLALLLVPGLCQAALTPYQESVVAFHRTTGTDTVLKHVYEEVAAGKDDPEYLWLVEASELVFEDSTLLDCALAKMQDIGDAGVVVTKLVAAGKGPALLADAKSVLGEKAWAEAVPATGTVDAQVDAAMRLLYQASMETSAEGDFSNRPLKSRLVMDYYLSRVVEAQCPASPTLLRQMENVRK